MNKQIEEIMSVYTAFGFGGPSSGMPPNSLALAKDIYLNQKSVRNLTDEEKYIWWAPVAFEVTTLAESLGADIKSKEGKQLCKDLLGLSVGLVNPTELVIQTCQAAGFPEDELFNNLRKPFVEEEDDPTTEEEQLCQQK